MKLIDFIICDDIRQETGGKLTLVGVYADRLIVHPPSGAEVSWPITMKLGFFFRFFNDRALTSDSFTVDILFNKSERLQQIKGNGKIVPDKKLINIFFVNNSFTIPSYGVLTARIVFMQGGEEVYTVSPDMRFMISAVPQKQQTTTVH